MALGGELKSSPGKKINMRMFSGSRHTLTLLSMAIKERRRN
jgi:hypothetical protein